MKKRHEQKLIILSIGMLLVMNIPFLLVFNMDGFHHYLLYHIKKIL